MDAPCSTFFRYFDKREYAIQFVEKGLLRLPSLHSFRKHPDEKRRDEREGVVGVMHKDAFGNSLRINTSIGQNALVLCLSSKREDNLARKFGRVHAFKSMTSMLSRLSSQQLYPKRFPVLDSSVNTRMFA
jgi:hypothetical protein